MQVYTCHLPWVDICSVRVTAASGLPNHSPRLTMIWMTFLSFKNVNQAKLAGFLLYCPWAKTKWVTICQWFSHFLLWWLWILILHCFSWFLVDKREDVCGCESGTCDCNKQTQTSFCKCLQGFEGMVVHFSSRHWVRAWMASQKQAIVNAYTDGTQIFYREMRSVSKVNEY